MFGYQSEWRSTAENQALIFPPKVDPNRFWAGPGGIGTSTVSRGSENITTWFVVGSIDTTIIVSVLWAPSCSSAPMSRMLRRSLPFHGWTDASLAAGPMLSLGSGVSPEAAGAPESPGAVHESPAPPKTHDRAPLTRRS